MEYYFSVKMFPGGKVQYHITKEKQTGNKLKIRVLDFVFCNGYETIARINSDLAFSITAILVINKD